MQEQTQTPAEAALAREQLNVVVVGHVDHGKSTLIGRLLADTQNLPEGKLEAIRERCARNSKPMEYAYLLDALKDEQAQGITIDTARCFFKTARRDFIIIDAPGHIEFLKNMVSGAARADAALLVIDAHEGVQENSRRHGYFLSMLGIDQFAVVINKMDLVEYRQDAFDAIEREYREFLDRIHLRPMAFVPVNSMEGVNVAARSPQTPWYRGPAVLDLFDLFEKAGSDANAPLRMPVQDVYKFTAMGDERRIVAGRIEAGSLRAGDALLFLPSNKRGVVKAIEAFSAEPPACPAAGESVGFTLTEQIYVTRGELVCREGEPVPKVSSRLRADLFWLGRKPMSANRAYKFKLGTAEVAVELERVLRVLDASNLAVAEDRSDIRRHEVAECILRTRRPVAFDLCTEIPRMGRFVVVDDYLIAGGGIVREALSDDGQALRQEAFQRERNWIRGRITPEVRAERYAQRAALILITGRRHSGRKTLARALEEHLFQTGRHVYYLGMGSVVHGLDADIPHGGQTSEGDTREHIRRLGEMLHVLLDTGMIVICTALELTPQQLRDIETLVGPAPMISIRIGEPDDGSTALQVAAPYSSDQAIPAIMNSLQQARIVPDLNGG